MLKRFWNLHIFSQVFFVTLQLNLPRKNVTICSNFSKKNRKCFIAPCLENSASHIFFFLVSFKHGFVTD